MPGEDFFCIADIGCCGGLQIHPAERDFEQFTDIRLVINNEYVFYHKIALILWEPDTKTTAMTVVIDVG